MAGADEKRVHDLAERKGFRLDKVGKGQHRFYLTDVGSGAKMPADVPGHDYSFTLEEAKAWLTSRGENSKS